MLIRIAIEDDQSSLAELFNQYRQSLGQAAELAACEDFIQSRLLENDSVILVAIFEQKIVGFIQLYPSYSSLLLKPIWYFDDIFVIESLRKQGVATGLIEKAKQLAKETNVLAVRRTDLSDHGFVLLE
ncbi:GNAT family N-acetyltransferase [Shewanella sp. Isolate11]|uniref:GNAT family N-acetyltransferase n=1 Tax=Shewanella sp. Isolate11 TaxID=2908530 RepID=UPI001EFEDDA0|nr:GNAT family N-acetyltransferase [Shewanella sp. Isolate11]MCG9697065.1 GNAT family N-acetyltransferase [Shewanella sp. Isolate11]